MLGDHDLCGLPEEGAHEKSPKCLGGNLGDFWGDFAKVSNSVRELKILLCCQLKENLMLFFLSQYVLCRQGRMNGLMNKIYRK